MEEEFLTSGKNCGRLLCDRQMKIHFSERRYKSSFALVSEQ